VAAPQPAEHSGQSQTLSEQRLPRGPPRAPNDAPQAVAVVAGHDAPRAPGLERLREIGSSDLRLASAVTWLERGAALP
jgi:hypothetical protein